MENGSHEWRVSLKAPSLETAIYSAPFTVRTTEGNGAVARTASSVHWTRCRSLCHARHAVARVAMLCTEAAGRAPMHPPGGSEARAVRPTGGAAASETFAAPRVRVASKLVRLLVRSADIAEAMKSGETVPSFRFTRS